jgi:hypothetical protein
MSFRFIFKVLPWLLLCLLGMYVYISRTSLFDIAADDEKTEITNHIIVEKIELLGKLELCKFYIKDIVEHKEIKPWYNKDSKVVLIVAGEAVGCIDLTKIDSSAIEITATQLIVTLPPAEVCSFKIDHQASNIYDLETGYFEDDKKVIDKAYKLAEKEVLASALKMGIETQTRVNAEIILKPFLKGFTDKEIVLK